MVATPAGVVHNLPAERIRPIGRERDIAAVSALLLDPDTPLVTLSGSGGMGKTTLALYVAADLLPAFADGVTFVDLTLLADPALIAGHVARAAGLIEAADLPPDQALAEHYAGRHALLLLDNFEHLLDGATVAGDLLRACPDLRVLVTSREPLRLRRERVYPLSPLALPGKEQAADLEALAQVAAVELFVRRAQAARPAFELTAENAASVAAIVARLDGLPLAIELAAARIRLFPPASLLARLEASLLAVLAGGARDLPARQQTIRAAIAWSYDLLEPAEARLFRRLGVFVRGFSIEAADAVAAVAFSDGAIDALTGVESLLDKNLALRLPEERDEARLGLLETLRAFALEQLEAVGETEQAWQAHFDHYLALAEAAWPQLRGPQAGDWIARLADEEDNLRAALTWSLDKPPPAAADDPAIRLAGAMGEYWLFAGRQQEGRLWTDRAIARLDARPIPTDMHGSEDAGRVAAAARLLSAAGTMAWLHSDFPAAATFHERAADAYRLAGDERGELRSRHDLTLQLMALGRYAESLDLAAQCVEGYARLGDWYGLALAHGSLGLTHMRAGDAALSRSHLELALENAGRAGDSFMVAASLNNLGQAEMRLGQLARAEAYLSASLAEATLQQQQVAEIDPVIAFGRLRELQGDAAAALGFNRRAVRLAHEAHNRIYIADALEQTAFALHLLGDPARAARLLGAAAALRQRMGAGDTREHAWYYDERLPRVREALSDIEFAAAWQFGRALSREQAVALALEAREQVPVASDQVSAGGEQPAGRGRAAEAPPAEPLAELTPREREVALLMARGLTNEQIAEQLFITLKTVEKHAGNALGKLGFRSRVELAVWVAAGSPPPEDR